MGSLTNNNPPQELSPEDLDAMRKTMKDFRPTPKAGLPVLNDNGYRTEESRVGFTVGEDGKSNDGKEGRGYEALFVVRNDKGNRELVTGTEADASPGTVAYMQSPRGKIPDDLIQRSDQGAEPQRRR